MLQMTVAEIEAFLADVNETLDDPARAQVADRHRLVVQLRGPPADTRVKDGRCWLEG